MIKKSTDKALTGELQVFVVLAHYASDKHQRKYLIKPTGAHVLLSYGTEPTK